MIYFFISVIFLMLFLFYQPAKRSSVKYLIRTMLCYTLALLFMIMYLSRDVRYYNIIEDYFLLPKSLWKSFMFITISKSTIIRLMNLFNLLTIFWGCQFSLTYLNQHALNSKRLIRILLQILFLFLLTEYLIYDPTFSKYLYLFLYPRFLSVQHYDQLRTIIHFVTMCINCLLILISMGNLLWISRKIRFFPSFKYYAYGEIFSYIMIMISWLLLLGFFPEQMVRFSRVSGYTSYKSLELYGNLRLYELLPYYLIFSSVLMCVCAFAISRFHHRLNQKEFTRSGQIDAVNTSYKSFCHYMKNELLAIEAETQLLEIAPENQPELDHILERCQNLYGRLDKLHRSTRLSKLTMEHTDLEVLIRSMLDRMTPELHGYQVHIRKNEEIPSVLIDANYFEQAIHNIVTNALDAMAALPEDRKNLTFTLRTIDNWVALSITDSGNGISPEEIPHIFEPFYTSQPMAQHWGIGMTMTYQIVKAHHGNISIESKVGKGTTFRILLPNLKKMLP